MSLEISIVIPAYNASRYIAECISSVCAQTFTSWELIVIDDGSTDNTAEIVKGFLSDNRIKLTQQKNRGVSAARNLGIKEAKGKYIAFLDADDTYTVNNLQYKYDILRSAPEIDFIYSDLMHCNESMQDLYIEKGASAENLFEEVLLWEKETIPCLPSNVIIKASAMQGKFLFNENLSNCADRYLKIHIAKHLKGYYLPGALIKYRHTPGSMSSSVSLLEHDEKYIISQLRSENIIPSGSFRRRVISNIYFILAGSWYKNAHNPLRATKFALKAIFMYPPALFRLVKKLI